MSENSPRWPGRNGSPGLDFSPYRKTGEKVEEPVGAKAKEAETATATVITPKPNGAPEDKRPNGAPQPKGKGSQPGKPQGTGGQSKSATGITPKASERAASTAKEWAAVPVTGMPAAPTAPTHPGTPSRPEPKPAPSTTDAATPAVDRKPRSTRRTRKARLRLSRIDPWSVMKTTLLFAIAFGIMMVVVVFVLWSVLAGSGALESANTLINTVLSDTEGGGSGFKLEDFLTVERVMGFAVVLAVIDAVIITAVATLFAFLYNLAATVMGGLEVTLAED